jgi:hypothetical protein
MSTDTYHVQPMTGMVHTAANCSVGTARYGTLPATSTNVETHQLLKDGRLSECKKCGPTAMGYLR